MPERPFDQAKFLAAVKAARKFGFVSIVCGEGITYADGTPVSASKVTDKFSNVEFGAMGGTSAAMMLHRMIANAFGWRGEFQVTESLQMCAADRAVKPDYRRSLRLRAKPSASDARRRRDDGGGEGCPDRTALTLMLANVYMRAGRFDQAIARLAPW